MPYILNDVASAIGTGLKTAGNYTKGAADRANGVSAAAQSAQGLFNQNSVNLANNLSSQNLANQYAYNSAQAQMANNYSSMMWDKSAAWNEMMWDKMAQFNAQEAEKNRKWQEMMRATAYQTAVQDMEKAGINPILASGGISVSAGGGGAASAGGASMSPMSGAMASGSVLGGQAASESSYTGQMEYMSGMLGLLSTAFAGITSAMKVFNDTPNGGEMASVVGKMLEYFGNEENNETNPKKWFSVKPGSIADQIFGEHNKHGGSSGKLWKSNGNF